jgi:deazaflavin-dependent oxidoreductase (nitroreductase family)
MAGDENGSGVPGTHSSSQGGRRRPSGAWNPGRFVRAFFRAPLRLYDWNLGWLLGHRFLRLTHQGRRSGRQYRTVLEVVGHDRTTGEYFVVAGFGKGSDWYRNIQAHPASEIVVAREHFVPEQRILTVDEAETRLAAYERRNRLAAPIVRTMLGRLSGQPYDGSDAARRAVVEVLPMIGFRPGSAA